MYTITFIRLTLLPLSHPVHSPFSSSLNSLFWSVPLVSSVCGRPMLLPCKTSDGSKPQTILSPRMQTPCALKESRTLRQRRVLRVGGRRRKYGREQEYGQGWAAESGHTTPCKNSTNSVLNHTLHYPHSWGVYAYTSHTKRLILFVLQSV